MNSAAPTDETLVARDAAGDVAAFAARYERQEFPFLRFMVRLCRARATAEDLMQETWFAVTREAPRFRPDGRFAPWLYTIARHRVIDRHRITRATISLDATGTDDDDTPAMQLADERSLTPLAVSEQVEQGGAILAALARLPQEQREAFVLQAEGDLSVEEIAEVTGTTFETAKSRLRYARDKLKALLREHAP
jgi:RNA polymerase sigma-70 factor (ECF subfamily)